MHIVGVSVTGKKCNQCMVQLPQRCNGLCADEKIAKIN